MFGQGIQLNNSRICCHVVHVYPASKTIKAWTFHKVSVLQWLVCSSFFSFSFFYLGQMNPRVDSGTCSLFGVLNMAVLRHLSP